jgi:hypothetical protein
MNKFWEWMEKKGYCNDRGFSFWVSNVDGTKYHYPVGQIIGYVIEYIKDQNIYIPLDLNGYRFNNFDEIYDHILCEINKIEV